MANATLDLKTASTEELQARFQEVQQTVLQNPELCSILLDLKLAELNAIHEELEARKSQTISITTPFDSAQGD